METLEGEKIKYHSGVNPIEGKHLYNCVFDNKMERCMEIGCAFGTSALYICTAFKDNGIKARRRAQCAVPVAANAVCACVMEAFRSRTARTVCACAGRAHFNRPVPI